jgi:hypothetical protein
MWLITAAGSMVVAYAAYTFPYRLLDFRFLLLLLLTIVISSRVAIKVPRANTTITVADSFVFLTLLLYGPAAAVVVAAADGVSSGLRLSKRTLTVLFNAGAMA